MADLRFEELVLLKCDFEVWPEQAEFNDQPAPATGDDAPEAPESEQQSGQFDDEYPTKHLLRWKSTASREGDEFFLYLQARLEAPRFPFRLRFEAGARYATSPEDRTTAEQAKPTLVWLVYPFLRELIYNITSRSPLPPYSLPPLTRLPDPSLEGDQDPETSGP